MKFVLLAVVAIAACWCLLAVWYAIGLKEMLGAAWSPFLIVSSFIVGFVTWTYLESKI